jgi:hypothetical protein
MGRVGFIRIVIAWSLLRLVLLMPAVSAQNGAKSPVEFVDRAREAGLTAENIFGRADRKDYIIESTGTGVAIFDYDNDGWPDIFIANGTTLTPSSGQQPTHHLYHNNRDGTFTDVTGVMGPLKRLRNLRGSQATVHGVRVAHSLIMTAMASSIYSLLPTRAWIGRSFPSRAAPPPANGRGWLCSAGRGVSPRAATTFITIAATVRLKK